MRKIISVLFFIVLLVASTQLQLEAAEEEFLIRWEIDRSSAPNLPYNDVTLNVAVGEASGISVTDFEGNDLSFTYDERNGVVSITTEGDSIELSFFTETSGNQLVGSYAPATLKHNRQWAWSHGFDDNFNLDGPISQFEERDWRGTLFLIGEPIIRPAGRGDVLTTADIQSLLADGWSLGNHSFDYYECDPRPGEYEENIVDGQNVLNGVIESSTRPDYTVISFAAPCFLDQFHPAVISVRENPEVSLRVNESGGRFPLLMDKNAIDLFVEDIQVFAYNPDLPIGRDATIDGGTLEETIRRIDWIARNLDSTRHIWYNSLSHGESEPLENEGTESRLGSLIEYVYRNYGPLGTNEVWVAPSDQVISYVTLRDIVEFEVVSASRNSESIDPSLIREVEQNSVGQLESSGFLPTRVRPEDTPIPIIAEAIPVEAVPTAQDEEAVAETTPTPEPVTPEPTEALESEEVALIEEPVVEEEIAAEAPADQPEDSSNSPSRPSTALIIVVLSMICVIAMLILGAIFYVFSRMRSKN
ncbi:MAG: hypothetical protein AAGD96_08990 [Chloroflexota bacterium]